MMILLISLFMTAGLLVSALAVQSQTAKDLYQTESKIRTEQALQLEQAAQNYASALHVQAQKINSLLQDNDFMTWECLALSTALPEPTGTAARVSPPTMELAGRLPVEIEVRVTATPHSGCQTKPANESLQSWLGAPTVANTRMKYKTLAKIGCLSIAGNNPSSEELSETCITRTRYNWVDR